MSKLYGLRRYFLRRHCHGLTYASQNEVKVDRLNHKMRKLRSKVGCSSDDLISPFPDKPKGMHWDTFDRLEWKDWEANREKMLIMSEEISRLEEEYSHFPTNQEEE